MKLTLCVLVIMISSLALPISQISAEKSSGVYELTHNDIVYEIPYTIVDARIRSISLEDDFETVLISLFENHRDGSLEITLPRELVVNYKRGEINEPVVVIDSKEVKVDVLYKDEDVITITFGLPAQSENISIIKTILLSTSSLSRYLSHYWISRGEVLSVKGFFYDLKTDAEFADFEIKITGPLPENSPIFSEIITVKNGGNFSLPIKISDTMEPGKYNVTIFPTNTTVTKIYSLTSFIVRGPAFVPIDIKYIGPNSTAKLQYIYTDTNSVMFIDTNSSRYNWYASAETKTIQITVVGKEGTRGYMNLVIPREVMDGVEEVKIVPRAYSEYSIDTNSTHTKIMMNYLHNEKETSIIIRSAFMVPEFPLSLMVMTISVGAFIVAGRMIRMNRR